MKQLVLLFLSLTACIYAAPESFNLLWPENASTITTQTPNLQWEVNGDVDHYEVWVDSTKIKTILAPPDGHRCRYPSVELSEGSHQWYVVAVDALGEKRQSSSAFMVTVQQQLDYDVVVYGSTSAGVTAVVQAKKMGKQAVLIEGYPNHGRLGGLSSGGLGDTDSGDKSVIGGLSREFYSRLGQEYGKSSPQWLFEPHVALKVFDDFVNEYNIPVFYHERLDRSGGGVQKTGSQITSITMESGKQFTGRMFIDATYEGDLMAESGVTYTTGREANSVYNEKYNGIQVGLDKNQLPLGIDPYVIKGDPSSGLLPGVNPDAGGANGEGDNKIQAYNYRMCLTNNIANRVMVSQPAGYDEKDYEILFRAIEDGGQSGGFFKLNGVPDNKTDSNNSGGISTDYIGYNYPYSEGDYAIRDLIAIKHGNYQKGFVWTLQNHPRIPQSIRDFYAPWGLPMDEFLENGHWPSQIYVREARRMVSDFVMTGRHLRDLEEVSYPIGMGSYTMDSHNVQRFVGSSGYVRNEGDVQIYINAYAIDYGSIIPKASQASNLLVPVCVSASHIAYGSIRMEPVFMILGQSASTAAVLAIEHGVSVQNLNYHVLAQQLNSDGQVIPVPEKKDIDAISIDENANLLDFTAGGIVYSNIEFAAITPQYTSATQFWSDLASDKGSATAALNDLSPYTGVLNPGPATIYMFGKTLEKGDVGFLICRDDGPYNHPGEIIAIDAAGNDLYLSAGRIIGVESQFGPDITWHRNGASDFGNPLSGWAFTIDNFSGSGDRTLIAGIRIGGSYGDRWDPVIAGYSPAASFSVDAGPDMISWSGQPVQLNVTVEDGITGPSYQWSATPVDGVAFSATDVQSPEVAITKDTENPSVVTVTVTVNSPYKAPATDTLTIDVYDDACKSAIAIGKNADNPTDLNDDCLTNIEDLAEMVSTWLNDHNLSGPIDKL